jgi:hypothetical protein
VAVQIRFRPDLSSVGGTVETARDDLEDAQDDTSASSDRALGRSRGGATGADTSKPSDVDDIESRLPSVLAVLYPHGTVRYITIYIVIRYKKST